MKNKFLLLAGLLFVFFNGRSQSTCQAAFTYTLGSNGQVSFTDTTTLPFPIDYSWSFGDGQWSNQQNPGIIIYAYNGTYNVSLSMNDSTAGCNSYTTTPIVVTTASPCNLQAAFTYTLASNGHVDFTNTTLNASGYTSYSWQFPGSHDSASAGSTFPINYVYNGTYTVNLSANNSNGPCSSYFTDTIVVTNGINCNMIPSFTTSAGSTGLINFTNTTTGTTVSNFNWDFGYGAYSNQANPSYTYTYNTLYSVTLYVSDSTGLCNGSVTNTFVVTNATPCPTQASFTYSLGASGQVTFQNTSTGLDSASLYNWNFGDNTYSNDSVSVFSHTYSNNGTYYPSLIIGNNHSPCLSSFSDTIVITNSNNCIPTINFSMIKDTTQVGVWSAVANYSSNVTSAIWYWGDGTSSPGFSPTHTYTSAGMYNICVQAISTCGDSVMVCQSDSLYKSNSSMISVTVINNTGVGIASHISADNTMILFPNPSTDGEFTITNINSHAVLRVLNVYGQEVNAEITRQNGNAHIHISSSGAYFVNVKSREKNTSLKVIVTKE
jgi:PKD repeat protein